MAVHQLGREARRVGRDCVLALEVQRAVRSRRGHHVVAARCEELVPKRQQLVHVEAHRDADDRLARVLVCIASQKPALFFEHIVFRLSGLHARDRLFAAVAADELPAARESVDGQLAVVRAAVARNRLDAVRELVERLG